MASTGQTISVYEGETRAVQITISTEDGSAFPAGYEVYWRAATPTPITRSTVAADLVVNEEGADYIVVAFTLLPAETDGLASRTVRHEAKVTVGDAEYVVTKGLLSILHSEHGDLP